MRTKTEKILFIPDSHYPFQDKRACKMVHKIARDWQPDRLVILGDYTDCASVSSHDKDPTRFLRLKDETVTANRALDDLAHIKKKDFVCGNHEFFLDRYIMKHAPALHGLVDTDMLLGLTKRGFKITPYMNHMKIGKLHVTHDVKFCGADAHIRSMREFGGNVIIGHTHRIGKHIEGNAKGEMFVGAMPGWLGNKKTINYTDAVKSNKWALGFATGLLLPNGNVHIDVHELVDYTCRLDGVVING